jgi:cytochrome b pre-mRNA-processing protein 3
LGVADTIDGRFDLVVLHLFLVLDRLRDEGDAGKDVASSLTNLAFNAFEEALRELGVSDMGMSRRVKAMANAFYGRLEAYTKAGTNIPELAAALSRNLYRGEAGHDAQSAAMAHYILKARRHLRSQAGTALILGRIDFGPLPEFEAAK